MPNVLVVSTNGFSKVNCNKTYESIFSAFEKKNLYSFFTRPQDSYLDFSYCESYYAVSESDIIRCSINRSNICGGIIQECNNQLRGEIVEARNSFIYRFLKKMNAVKQNLFLKDLLWKTDLWWTDELKAWLNSTNADVIFFHDPGIVSFHRMLKKIVTFLKVPYVYYITDDYYIYYTETMLQRMYLKRLIPVCKETLSGAAKRYCIGDMMAKEYNNLFGVTFDTVMNCVKVSPVLESSNNSFKIASYFGGLHLDRWKMISRFADIFDGEIQVYTATPLEPQMEKALAKTNIRMMGCVYGNDLNKAMRQSDILLHIESDDIKFMQRTKLAISTKIPEYLSMGKLTIGFGNPELASMRILSDNKVGIVIDSRLNPVESAAILKSQINSTEVECIRKNAIQYANSHFNESVIAKNIKMAINEILIV